jgi:hypothetical protein
MLSSNFPATIWPLEGRGKQRRNSAVYVYLESDMLKSKHGEAVYWLVGTATVMLATWQFAVVVTY